MKFNTLIGPLVLTVGLVAIYYQFFFLGKIPIPGDLLVGAYYPWLDYNWGYSVGVPVKNPPITDVISQLYLWRTLAVDLIRSGNWPLWNPYSSSGTPLLANFQSAPFLPFNVLLLLPKYFGWGIYLFSQSVLAAFGMYLLLTKYKLERIPRIAGALVFCLSGLMSTYVEFAMAVFAAASLVWIFFAIEAFRQTRKMRYLVLLTAAFVWLYLSGHAQLGLYGTILFLVYLCQLIFKRVEVKRITILPLIFWILAIGITALQLFPTFDYISGSSIRGIESYSKLYNFGLTPWYEFIKIIAADFFGNPVTYNYWGFFYYHDVSLFLGTLTLPFLIPLIFKRFRNSIINFWGAVFVISLFLGFDNPLSHVIYSFPIPLLTNSSASRIFFLVSLSGAILLAFSIQRYILDKKFSSFVQRSNLLIFSGLLVLLTGLVIVTFPQNSVFLPGDSTVTNLKISFRNSVLPLILLGILIIFLKFISNRRIVVYIVVLLLFLDLGRYFLKHNPFVDSSLIYPRTPTIDFLQNQQDYFRLARADAEIIPPNTWIAYGLSSVEGYDPLSMERYSRLINRSNKGSFGNGVTRYIEVKEYPSKFLDALNVKYFLAVKRDEEGRVKGDFLNRKLDSSGFKKVFEDKNSVVLENPNAKDRAYFVNKVKWVASELELIHKIDARDFDPTQQAIVEGKGSDMTLPSTGKIDIIDYQPGSVTLKTETDGERFMVLADTFDKGWQLFENGHKKDLYLTNGALRGIVVKKGLNQYQLIYRPNSFDIGLKITIGSLVVFISIIFYNLSKAKISSFIYNVFKKKR